MSANITWNTLTGKFEAMIRGAAWHPNAQFVGETKNWKDTMNQGGLQWTVSIEQLEYNGLKVPAYGVFREDYLAHGMIDKAFVCPATETRQVLQNEDMFIFLDAVLESENAHYESAGSLNNGAQVWALVNLHEAFEIGGSGDRFESYLCFTEDRTGERAAKCFMTTVRVVCANTLGMAYSESERTSAPAQIKFRHSGDMHAKLEQALGAFQGARMNAQLLKAKLDRLSDKLVTKSSLAAILDRLFPATNEKQVDSAARIAKMAEVCRLFEENDSNMFPEVRGTGYNLLNAVTEYTDHFSKVRRNGLAQTDEQIRGERALFGKGFDFKAGALDVILEEMADAPLKATRRVAANGAALDFASQTEDGALLESILSGSR